MSSARSSMAPLAALHSLQSPRPPSSALPVLPSVSVTLSPCRLSFRLLGRFSTLMVLAPHCLLAPPLPPPDSGAPITFETPRLRPGSDLDQHCRGGLLLSFVHSSVIPSSLTSCPPQGLPEEIAYGPRPDLDNAALKYFCC